MRRGGPRAIVSFGIIFILCFDCIAGSLVVNIGVHSRNAHGEVRDRKKASNKSQQVPAFFPFRKSALSPSSRGQ